MNASQGSPVIRDSATSTAESGKSVDWYPPLPVWKLLLLLFLTFGVYSIFYMYRVARELRDNGNEKFIPWLYSISFLIPLATAIAAGRLAGGVRRLAETRNCELSTTSPILIGVLVFLGYSLFSVTGLSSLMFVYLIALAAYCVPWLLLQRQLNRVKADLPDESFRTRRNRYTRLQWCTLAVGLVPLGIISVSLWDDAVRLSASSLIAGEVYVDPQGRFQLTAPREGWVIAPQGYIAEDAELELIGPGPSDFAIVYVHEQAGWSIDDLVEFRYSELSGSTPLVGELRSFFPGTEIAVSNAKYSGTLPFEGASDYHVASYVTDKRAVEFLVFTAGPRRESSRGQELLLSLRPGNEKRAMQ